MVALATKSALGFTAARANSKGGLIDGRLFPTTCSPPPPKNNRVRIRDTNKEKHKQDDSSSTMPPSRHGMKPTGGGTKQRRPAEKKPAGESFYCCELGARARPGSRQARGCHVTRIGAAMSFEQEDSLFVRFTCDPQQDSWYLTFYLTCCLTLQPASLVRVAKNC